MSTLTFTMHGVGTKVHSIDEDGALQQPSRYPTRKAVIVVRNQKDYDYMQGLALVSGKPVEIVIDDNPNPYNYYPPFSWVFLANKQRRGT